MNFSGFASGSRGSGPIFREEGNVRPQGFFCVGATGREGGGTGTSCSVARSLSRQNGKEEVKSEGGPGEGAGRAAFSQSRFLHNVLESCQDFLVESLAEGRRRGALTSSPELGHQLGSGGGRGGPTRSTEGGSHPPPSKKIKKSSLRALLPFLGARRPRGSRKKEGRLEKSVAPACQRRRWFFFCSPGVALSGSPNL